MDATPTGGPKITEEHDDVEEEPPKKKSSMFTSALHWMDNIYIIAPMIFAASLAVGIVFYMYANDWDFALAYYFAASVLLGALYLVPSEPSPYSTIFTQWYFLWGTTLIMGAIAAMANAVLANASRVAANERKRIILSMEPVPDEEYILTWYGRYMHYKEALLDAIGWTDNRTRYIVVAIAVSCYGLGVLYGVLYEGWDVNTSLFFSLSAMSASGIAPPPCDDGDAYTCRLGTTRSLLVGTYLIVAVPIFTYTMGLFAELLVERAIRSRERSLMMTPLSDSEFRFAIELQGGLKTCPTLPVPGDTPCSRVNSFQPEPEIRLDLGDFIILELLRLKKISKHDLDYIRDLFDMLDADGDGVIIKPAVTTRRPFTSFDSNSLDHRTQELMDSRNEMQFLTPIRESSMEYDASSVKASAEDTSAKIFSRTPSVRTNRLERQYSRTENNVIPDDGDGDIMDSSRTNQDDDEVATLIDELEQEEEDELGGISAGYNNLIIPVMKQLSMRPSAKKRTVIRSNRTRSTSLIPSQLSRSPSVASSIAPTRRRTVDILTERSPLLGKRCGSESQLFSSAV